MKTRADFLRVQFDLGEWDQVIGRSGELLSWSMARDDSQTETRALQAKTQVLLERGGVTRTPLRSRIVS